MVEPEPEDRVSAAWSLQGPHDDVAGEEEGFATIEIIPSREVKPQLFAEVGNIKLYKEVSADYLKALLQ